VHRSCAVRCLSGGVPPLFVARDEEGRIVTLLLLDDSGERHDDDILDRVAEPVRVRGRLRRQGDLLRLEVAAADIERIRS
ncbi:MAG: hypothetical protein R3190_14055, partial [Thermoanaerobaculia bacterium]|nr:hypothetical protein [Thermoanaerobaculia bacterium]